MTKELINEILNSIGLELLGEGENGKGNEVLEPGISEK